MTPTAAAAVGSSAVLFRLLQKVPWKTGRRRQTAAQPAARQGCHVSTSLRLQLVDANGLIARVFAAGTASAWRDLPCGGFLQPGATVAEVSSGSERGCGQTGRSQHASGARGSPWRGSSPISLSLTELPSRG